MSTPEEPANELGMVALSIAVAGAALQVCGERIEVMGIGPSMREGVLFLSFLILVRKLQQRWTRAEIEEFERVARIALPFVEVLLAPKSGGQG
jgi:hypothetical protein